MAGVGLPSRMLGADEHEVLHTRTHAKALVGPALALIGTGALVGAGTAVIPSDYRPFGQVVVLVLGAALAGWACVRPFLRWRATTYSLTNRRLVMRTGVLTRVSVDLPLWRVTDVSVERSLGDRVLGCGTLVARTAGEGVVALRDVPEVQQVQRAVTEQLFGELQAAPAPGGAR
ncbi:PH domain-containing protein [Microlunatus flavus]|uniref:PH domain-containing protein n=1 Tax=Microlunatus flavus TaxID=1036181 RepID=A0A1H9CE91_9ACTN|nr:PH domain-containing protein [Microlunatus flavus]